MTNNLFFISIHFNTETQMWEVPSVLGSDPQTFEKKLAKAALKYAKDKCLIANQLTDNKVRYTAILDHKDRMSDGYRITLSKPTTTRSGLSNNTVTRRVFNIREHKAPDGMHRIYVGEILIGEELVDVYTTPTASPITRALPIQPNSLEFKEGAYFRAMDDLTVNYPAPEFFRGTTADSTVGLGSYTRGTSTTESNTPTVARDEYLRRKREQAAAKKRELESIQRATDRDSEGRYTYDVRAEFAEWERRRRESEYTNNPDNG